MLHLVPIFSWITILFVFSYSSYSSFSLIMVMHNEIFPYDRLSDEFLKGKVLCLGVEL